MAQKGREESNAAIGTAFSAIRSLPTVCGDTTITTSSAVLFADSESTAGYGRRLVRVYNASSSIELGIKLIFAGETASGHDISECMRLGPKCTWETVIGDNIRVIGVSASSSITVNRAVWDI